MAITKQLALGFDCLEGKVLLSSGMTDPAAAVHQAALNRFHLNGKLHGIPSGTAVSDGFIVSSFQISGNIASMGAVKGAFFLKYSFIQTGKLPDLSKATLVLANQDGTVKLALNATGSHHYKFTITGLYTFASGKGSLTISGNHKSPEFEIKLQSQN
jgi:hypothetical protein